MVKNTNRTFPEKVQEHRDALKGVRSSAVANHSLRDTTWTGQVVKF